MYPCDSRWATRPIPSSSGDNQAPGVSQRRLRRARGNAAPLTLLATLLLLLSGCALPQTQGNGLGTPTSLTPVATKVRLGPKIQEVGQTTMLTGANTGPASVSCPAGEVALGGGWKVATQGVHVIAAFLSGDTWQVYASHTVQSKVVVPIVVTAYVECLYDAPGAVVTQRATSDVIASNGTDNAFGLCNPGESPVGLGFDLRPASANLEFQGGVFSIIEGLPVVAGFVVANHDSAAHSIALYMECLASGIATASYPPVGGPPVNAGMAEDLHAPCPAGSVLAAGGFEYGDRASADSPVTGNLYLEHATSSGWEGAVYILTGSLSDPLHPPTVVAVCLTFPSQGPTEP